jgi:hypothetical protein
MLGLLSLSALALFLFSGCGGGGIDAAGPTPTGDFQSQLVRITQTSDFNPPSPDPTGIVYIAGARPAFAKLTVVDSAIDRLITAGDNVFELFLNGTLDSTAKTLFSQELTGITFDPVTRRLFFSDDQEKMVYVMSAGPDGRYYSADDVVSSFSTSGYGNDDPEDLTFDSWAHVLFVTDGANNEVYRVSPGINGRFDGVSPAGDDTVTQFDTSAINNPEGIAFNNDTGNLYLAGDPKRLLFEVTTAGDLVRKIDISAAAPFRPVGLTYAPASDGSDVNNIYIVDRGRGIHPVNDPNQNAGIDGRLYEMTLPPNPRGNRPPSANAGPDLKVTLPASALLDGSAGDDGLGNPPGALTTLWTQRAGPRKATIADPNVLDTSVTLPNPGTYVLRLTVDDGKARAFDEAAIRVLQSGQLSRQFRISGGADDAEEGADGAVARGNDDLELMRTTQGGVAGGQTVGLRYANVDIPRGARIIRADVQFTAASISSETTTLTIQGEVSDDARPFLAAAGNISSRPRTAAAADWSPPPWDRVGAAGPAQRTSDVKAVLQEIVNRPGWISGNDLALIITGSGRRVARSYNAEPKSAPSLNVIYATDE